MSVKNALPIVFVAAAAIGFAAVTSAAQANLLTNGSFENGNFNGCANPDGCGDNTMSLPVGSTAITGWTVTNGSLAWIGPDNPFGLTAANGSYFLDLTDYRDASPYGGVASVTVATVVGATYALTFDLGSDPTYGVQDGLTAGADGFSQQFTSTNDGSQHDLWQLETFTFVANSASTTITLTGATGEKYIGLDNVALNQTPLPAALPIFAGGLGMIGLIAGRKKRKAAATATV